VCVCTSPLLVEVEQEAFGDHQGISGTLVASPNRRYDSVYRRGR
jgi:hypothetical protein